jgi:hypothetical protein
MSFRARWIWITFLALCSAAGAARENAGPITVDVRPTEVRERTFDRNHLPSEMPPMQKGEAAVTVSEFAADTKVSAEVVNKGPAGDGSGCDATVKVTGVTVRPTLKITVWLPNDATQKIRDHEYGHRKISEIFYERAGGTARELAKRILGRTYRGHADDCDAAVKDAIRSAINEVNTPFLKRIDGSAGVVQDRYDEITDHSRKKIGEDEAIAQAMRESKQ